MDRKGQIIIDVFFVLFAIILSFLVFFSLTTYKKDQFEKTIKFLTITENAISKNNPNGIGFADFDADTKTTLKNTIKEIKLVDPIKKIELYDYNTKIMEIGDTNCYSKIVISRLVIYEDKITKINFTFCD